MPSVKTTPRTVCTDPRCRKHYGTSAAGQGERRVRVGWYHEYGEPHHVPGCRYYAGATDFHGLAYDSREEAERAGHAPARCCRSLP